jgi:hypothetical protein
MRGIIGRNLGSKLACTIRADDKRARIHSSGRYKRLTFYPHTEPLLSNRERNIASAF